MIYRDDVNIELVILSIYMPAPFKAGIWRITLRGGGNTLNLDIIPLIFSSTICHLFSLHIDFLADNQYDRVMWHSSFNKDDKEIKHP